MLAASELAAGKTWRPGYAVECSQLQVDFPDRFAELDM